MQFPKSISPISPVDHLLPIATNAVDLVTFDKDTILDRITTSLSVATHQIIHDFQDHSQQRQKEVENLEVKLKDSNAKCASLKHRITELENTCAKFDGVVVHERRKLDTLVFVMSSKLNEQITLKLFNQWIIRFRESIYCKQRNHWLARHANQTLMRRSKSI
jgi:septal ring factor EnvC (AmiA/AmiB activator)